MTSAHQRIYISIIIFFLKNICSFFIFIFFSAYETIGWSNKSQTSRWRWISLPRLGPSDLQPHLRLGPVHAGRGCWQRSAKECHGHIAGDGRTNWDMSVKNIYLWWQIQKKSAGWLSAIGYLSFGLSHCLCVGRLEFRISRTDEGNQECWCWKILFVGLMPMEPGSTSELGTTGKRKLPNSQRTFSVPFSDAVRNWSFDRVHRLLRRPKTGRSERRNHRWKSQGTFQVVKHNP